MNKEPCGAAKDGTAAPVEAVNTDTPPRVSFSTTGSVPDEIAILFE
jgi:hypothetical protein